MSSIFFVHVPKTAGTSFRKSAESYFGEGAVLYDYSAQSEETSPLVNSHVYQQPDLFEFYHAQKSNRFAFLSGHVNAGKYMHLFGACHTVTF